MKTRLIAYYLPQFHPIPENDKWWGKGFTEWTNVGKAKVYFKGHYQPRVPADLGYYDLRVPETRQAQADMAREYGIEGFCYWHYWFGNGKRLLERPFNEVLQSGTPDFPFCLAWANESWKGFSHGLTNRNVLIEQTYPGKDDYIAHFNAILPAFMDFRYIKIDGKPLFVILKYSEIPNVREFIDLWQILAEENGLKGIHFIAHQNQYIEVEEDELQNILRLGFDSVNFVRLSKFWNKRTFLQNVFPYLKKRIFGIPRSCSYNLCIKYVSDLIDKKSNVFPTIIPNWDHSPRSGKHGLILTNSTPELFSKHISEVLEKVKDKDDEHKIVFIKSWNEWAEGNYMEPDLRWGLKYLEATKRVLEEYV
jgi:hypothetical protein